MKILNSVLKIVDKMIKITAAELDTKDPDEVELILEQNAIKDIKYSPSKEGE